MNTVKTTTERYDAGLRRRRSDDLARAWRRVIERRYRDGHAVVRTADIAALVVAEPAPEYYITLSRAEKLLRLYRDNRLPATTRESTWALAAELSQRVNDELVRGVVTTLTAALARVLVTGHASRFFVTPYYAGRIVASVSLRHRRRRSY